MSVIQELEMIAKERSERMFVLWSEDEEDTLKRYYGRVPIKRLLEYLPGRTAVAVRYRVCLMRKRGAL